MLPIMMVEWEISVPATVPTGKTPSRAIVYPRHLHPSLKQEVWGAAKVALAIKIRALTFACTTIAPPSTLAVPMALRSVVADLDRVVKSILSAPRIRICALALAEKSSILALE